MDVLFLSNYSLRHNEPSSVVLPKYWEQNSFISQTLIFSLHLFQNYEQTLLYGPAQGTRLGYDKERYVDNNSNLMYLQIFKVQLCRTRRHRSTQKHTSTQIHAPIQIHTHTPTIQRLCSARKGHL